MAKDDAVHWKFDAFQLVTREFREVHPFEVRLRKPSQWYRPLILH
jgi:hypothetical protein